MSEITSQLDQARDRLKTQAPTDGYLTKQEAARLARCSERQIQRAVHETHELPAYRPGGRLLFREEDVRQWIESKRADQAEQARPRSRSRRARPGSVANLRDLERSAR